MAAKKIWVTWLPTEDAAEKPDPVIGSLQSYGFQVSGAPWRTIWSGWLDTS